MATAAAAIAAIDSALASTLSGTRMASDILLDESIAAGSTKYQINKFVGSAIVDSDRTRPLLQLTVSVHHALADPTDERAYTEGDMISAQSTLSASSYWYSLAEILGVVEPVASTGDPSREGNVISFEFTVQLTVA